jgi:imidazolonepropionase-like amidohydrolase
MAFAATPCTAVVGTTAWTDDGIVESATVVVAGERVVALSASAADVRVDGEGRVQWRGQMCLQIDGEGTHTTPGFVEVSSQLGVTEVDLESKTRTYDAGGDPMRASVRVADAYNPRSSLIPIQRVEGVTEAIVQPRGGFISGYAAGVQLAGASQADAVLNWEAAMHVGGLEGGSLAGTLASLSEMLDDARNLRRRSDDLRSVMAASVNGASRADLNALYPVLDGRVPLLVSADRASSMEAWLRFADREGVKLIISGASEGWLIAEQLAQAKVPVIVDPLVYGPGGFDQMQARAENPALLAEAGVRVILSTFETHNARNLKQIAGNAVRGGMTPEAAVTAITRTASESFGLPSGHLQVGERASLVVWSGQPLSFASHPQHVFIGGEQVSLESRQTRLLDAYRTLPGTPPALP